MPSINETDKYHLYGAVLQQKQAQTGVALDGDEARQAYQDADEILSQLPNSFPILITRDDEGVVQALQGLGDDPIIPKVEHSLLANAKTQLLPEDQIVFAQVDDGTVTLIHINFAKPLANQLFNLK